MNLWIFVFSALFTPVVEPMGFAMEGAQEAPVPELVADPLTDDPRYPGIERLFAKLDGPRPIGLRGQNR